MTLAAIVEVDQLQYVIIPSGDLSASLAAQARADALIAETAAATAEAFAGPTYANQAAGEAATTTGQYFAVYNGGIVSIYVRTGGGSTLIRTMHTTDSLDATLASDFIDMASPTTVNGATALVSGDLNSLVICGDGVGNYTVNLPAVTISDVGKAVKINIARTCNDVVTIQAAVASGLNVDGQSDRKMIAGESALFVYEGSSVGWVRYDYVCVPIRAEMFKSGATTLAVGAFTDIPMPAAGTQLMDQDLKAIWGYTGGFFTAPRLGIYNIKGYFWLSQTGAPGQIDVGCYVATSGGGSPTANDFTRTTITNNTFQKVELDLKFRLTAGQKLYPCISLIAPISAGAVVDSATIMSKLVITELPL